MKKPSIFDLEHQLGFYGAYHSNHTNVLIHILFVPLIMFSAQYFLTYYFHAPPQLAHLTQDIQPEFKGLLGFLGAGRIPWRWEMGGGAMMALVYAAYYAALDLQATLLYIPSVLLPMTLISTALASKGDTYWYPMLALQISSWLAQFAGHGFAEGRAPALLDNLLGAVVLAPFFTFIEVLFFLGWRPKLKRAIEHASSKKIVELDRARSIRQSAAREQGKKMEEERRKRWEEITMQNKDSLGAVEREEIRQKMKEGKGGKVE